MRLIIILSCFLLFTWPVLANEASRSPKFAETITDYPINLKPLSQNAVLRIVKSQSKVMPIELALKNIQIIDHNKVVYKKDFITDDYPIGFIDYAIVQGSQKSYLLYKLDVISTSEIPDLYYVLYVDNQKIKEAQGVVLARYNSSKITINNPKISEHLYQLIDDKYISGNYSDEYCNFDPYFEIIDGKVYETANKEFKINNYNQFDTFKELREYLILRNIKVFTKPERQEKYQKELFIEADAKIEILGLLNTEPVFIKWVGIEHSKPFGLVHIRINGVDYWISEGYLGMN